MNKKILWLGLSALLVMSLALSGCPDKPVVEVESVEELVEAEEKLAIAETMEIGNLLQDYYNMVREYHDRGIHWWKLHGNFQDEVNFAASLAKHGIGAMYWSYLETSYQYRSGGTYSKNDALKILDDVLFSAHAIGIDYDQDSDYEKIKKILNFFSIHIDLEYDFSQNLRAPAETIGLGSGDCDDFAILASAAFARVGINSAIMFVVNEERTYTHAMVLIQSEEVLPLWYYSDLSEFGLPNGKWWIIEPQFSLAGQKRPLVAEWTIEATALVKYSS